MLRVAAVKYLVSLASLLPLATTAIAGDDVGFVTLKNSYQQNIVQNIVDRAFTRVDNNILCVLDEKKTRMLQKSGIEVEVILFEIDLENTYLIRQSSKAEFSKIDLKAMSGVHSLGRNMYLSVMGRQSARSLADDPYYHATPLSELEVRIIYLAPVVTEFMGQVMDFPSDSVALLVNQDSLYAFDTRLEAFRTRYIWSDSIDAARDWMVSKLQAWGYTDVTTPNFWYGGDWHYNIMAIKQGYAEPDNVIVVGGHYDSITYGQVQGPLVFAPGADDNASGTALTLELARIFANIPFRKTIIFMPFSAEEVGLVGSRAAAAQFVADGTNIEAMFNYDMVAYDPEDDYALAFSSGSNTAYRDISIAAAQRVTSLIIGINSAGSGSDHAAFLEQGFNIANHIEGNFNFPGWHTEIDLSTRLNFPFYTEVAKMAAASIAVVADAAHPTSITKIIDQGDGQSVELFWSDCDPSYLYTVKWGVGSLTNSADVPSGQCSYVLTGLTEGEEYRVVVVGSVTGGYPAAYGDEAIAVSLIIPRVPSSLTAGPELNQIILDWKPNLEADLSHYRVYRRESTAGNLVLYQDNVTDTFFVDNDVLGQTGYRYRIAAVDFDLNESGMTDEKVAYAATFDGGILVVDEISESWGVPDQAGQVSFFNTIFDLTPYNMVSIMSEYNPLTRNDAGQYSSIFWFDDDISSSKYIENSNDTLDWYLGYTGNMLLSGFMTVVYWGDNPYSSGDILYDEFGLIDYEAIVTQDFAGATGLNGWPDVEVDLGNVLGYLPYTPTMTKVPAAQIIYTFDSKDDDPAREGLPCGILMDTPNGKRVLLGFPLLHLTETSARAVIDYAKAQFGEDVLVYSSGDINRNGAVNVADITYLTSYLFGIPSGPAPVLPNLADVSGNCVVNISDVTYLVAYLFGVPTGPTPREGCVN